MNGEQKEILDRNFDALKELDLLKVAERLNNKGMFFHRLTAVLLNNTADPFQRCTKFLNMVKTQGNNPFQHLIECLKVCNYVEQAQKIEKANISEKVIDQFKQNLIPQLEDYIRNEAEHIRRFWQEYLDVVELKGHLSAIGNR